MFSFLQHIVDFVYFLVYPEVREPCELPSAPSSSEDCDFIARADIYLANLDAILLELKGE